MEVRLVIEQGRRRRQILRLRPPGGVVGRQKGSTIRIPSAEVSRQHCRLRLAGGLVTVEDLDSVNGTLLNGTPVRGQEHVLPGDRLEVGPVTFVVEYELTPQALEKLRSEQDEGLAGLRLEGEAAAPEFELTEEDLMTPASEPFELIVDQEERREEDEPIHPSFSFDGAWEMPQGDDLRDLLSQMEDEGEPPTKQRQKPP